MPFHKLQVWPSDVGLLKSPNTPEEEFSVISDRIGGPNGI